MSYQVTIEWFGSSPYTAATWKCTIGSKTPEGAFEGAREQLRIEHERALLEHVAKRRAKKGSGGA